MLFLPCVLCGEVFAPTFGELRLEHHKHENMNEHNS